MGSTVCSQERGVLLDASTAYFRGQERVWAEHGRDASAEWEVRHTYGFLTGGVMRAN